MKRNWVLVGLAAAALAVWLWPASHHARMRRRSMHSAAARVVQMREREQALALANGETDPALAASVELADDRYTNRSIPALLDRLSSPDQSLMLDAADGLRARKATFAIPKLASIDIVKNADAARTVIDAMGKLAGMAGATDRNVAVDRLLDLLKQEKAREAPDAVGNVLQLYEALGFTNDPRAASALEAELGDPKVQLAALTVVTASLVELAQPSSKAPLQAAHDRVQALSIDDEFEKEIQQEVVGKLGAAAASL